MSEPKPIQLGLCCMNTELRGLKKPVYCSRTIIIRIINEKGVEELKRRILMNLERSKIIAIVTGFISIAICISYLLLITIFDFRTYLNDQISNIT